VLAAGIFFTFTVLRDLSTAVLLYGYGSEVLSVAMLRYWTQGRQPVVSVLALTTLVVLVVLSACQRLLSRQERPAPAEEVKAAPAAKAAVVRS
jgi:ABC-type Fe3+ transport system permease subunit